MLKVIDVHKGYMKLDQSWKSVLKGISFELTPEMNLGILGRNGAGKSTLLRLISGMDLPDSGSVDKRGSNLSWPLGSASGVHGGLTGTDNIKFISRIYNKNYEEILEYVEEFAELSDYLDMPVSTYSTGMKGRLAFGISMAVEFDTYLIDEGFSAGDAKFKKRTQDIFLEKRRAANLVVVSHNPKTVKKFCNCAGVLHKGKLEIYDNVPDAIKIYSNL